MTSRRALGLGLAFAAGAACGWLVARGTAAEPAPDSAARGVADGPPDAGPAAPSADGAAAPRSRARRPGTAAGESGTPAFPGVRREPSSAGPPPPPAPQSEPAPQTAAAPLPAEAEALVAIIERAARSGEPLDAAAAERVNRAAVAIANLNPPPRLSLETIRALDLVHQDAANTVYPAVSTSEILAELDSMLAGTSSSWGDAQRANVWLIRFAALAAEQGTLSRAVAERLVASDDPWARAAAVEIAASHDLIDRTRLRALIRDPDPDVRSVAFSRFLETTPLGDETAALEEVRAWLDSDHDDPYEAVAMLPALGPGGATIAEEVVRRGGLPDADLAPALASLILHRRLDAVPLDATRGDVGSALVGWLKSARSTHEDADTAIAAFLRRSSIPADESLMDRWFELAVDAGDVQWLEVIARDRSHPAVARTHALDRYIEHLQAAGTIDLPACVLELVRDRTDDPAFRRMVLADILDRNYGRALACDLDLLAAVRDVAATEKNPHVRRAARDALESAERSLDSNK